MKKLFAVLLVIVVFGCMSAFAEADIGGQLGGMSLEELEALKVEIENRISTLRDENAANDPDNMGMWELRYYVDEFQLPTDDAYIVNTQLIEGTFSNSATTNSDLLVKLLIDEYDVAIMMYEYGSYQVNNPYSSDWAYYDVTMLDSEGERHYLTGYILANGGDRIFFDEEDELTILNAFKANGTVMFSIVDSERSIDSYLFTIEDTSYFSNAYNKLFE